MDNIICHTVNCEHNVKSRCVAGIVNITEKACAPAKSSVKAVFLHRLLPISRRRKTSARAISKTPSRARP